MEKSCDDLALDQGGESFGEQQRAIPNTEQQSVLGVGISNQNSDQSDSEYDVVRNVMKRPEIFSDSDSETDKPKKALTAAKDTNSDRSSEEETSKYGNNSKRKSRIKNVSSSEDSDSGAGQRSADNSQGTIKQSSRLNSKKVNLREKLQSLQKSRKKYIKSAPKEAQQDSKEPSPEVPSINSDNTKSSVKKKNRQKFTNNTEPPPQCVSSELVCSDFDDSSSSSEANEELAIEKIKQKIKERSTVLKSTLLIDPDTSDEDSEKHNEPPKYKRKHCIQSSPKPARMSAKQAMENMQKIRSESNRMLREKDVSLPYHRPKALSLKDIMGRRKTVLTPDGKALPLKMNDEQLKIYALSLEERQKEMIELCKSDTEDEKGSDSDENNKRSNSNENTIENNVISDDNSLKTEDVDNNKNDTTSQDNDTSFDVLINNEKQTDEIQDSIKKHDNDEKDEIGCLNSSNNDVQCEDISSETINGIRAEESNTLEMDIDNQKSFTTYHQQPDHENKGNHSEDQKNASESYNSTYEKVQPNTEPESQLISLHYSENIDNDSEPQTNNTANIDCEKVHENSSKTAICQKSPVNVENETNKAGMVEDEFDQIENFSDDDINMEDIDRLIENADLIESTQCNQTLNSPMLLKDVQALTTKPRLAGAPGMVIDLDGCDAVQPKKLSGVELLKQRFTYFAKLKTPEEIERAREKQIKPGFQHLKLKQELEEKIAKQKSIEWAKRLEEEKQQHMEMTAIRGGDSDEEDDIDKMEAKLAESDENDAKEGSDSSESEPEENDMEITDKPRKSNPLLDDEAEESECEEDVHNNVESGVKTNIDEVNDDNDGMEQNDESDEETSDEDSSDDNEEEENNMKPKKGRILKAFEDSDDETTPKEAGKDSSKVDSEEQVQVDANASSVMENGNSSTLNSQDDEIQSAQFQKSISEDIFNTQDLSSSHEKENESVSLNKTAEFSTILPEDSKKSDKLSVICETQPYDDSKFDEIVGMCSGSFSQNIIDTQAPLTDKATTQEIGDDILALCTGKFYDNQFVSQEEPAPEVAYTSAGVEESEKQDKRTAEEGNLLKSILEELDGPEYNDPKPNRFFLPSKANDESKNANGITQQKKRFMIDSDDEAELVEEIRPKKMKKKKKLKDRALQISDDEDELSEEEYADDVMSADEEDGEDDAGRVVEYDSEENEVPVLQMKKKRRKVADFFEQEAELTSEDEWVGSGDEDEAGLDRMEREEGDSERFNQATLQRELGQIHMRDVLDQDKREVRLLQELLLEDGDLGGGSRQRKFRWRNADGEEEIGILPADLADTQEEEFESEEQWRKQRHEREVFLRQMMQKEGDENESLNTSINRTAIIKANLVSKTMSSLLLEVNSPKEKTALPVVVPEKKTAKDIPSPAKKPFNVFQQNYRGSLLARGNSALARLAAIAAPLAGDSSEDNPKVASLPKGKSNFVFATLSPSTDEPKVAKRKNDGNVGTPQLMKKLKTEENREFPKISLMEHLKT